MIDFNISQEYMENINHINIVAWWGAIVASLAFGWNIFIWLKSGAKLKIRAVPFAWYKDGGVKNTQVTKDGETSEIKTYCHIEAINIGKLPTTIMSIGAEAIPKKSQKGIRGAFFDSSKFITHSGKNLPSVISPGEVWSCRFLMDDVESISKFGNVFIVIYASHLKKQIKINLSKKMLFALKKRVKKQANL